MKKRINWNEARPGLIVTFRYKGERTGISRTRECLLLDTNHRFTRADGKTVRLIHAIQLNSRPVVKGQKQINQKQIHQILEVIGDIELDPKTESFQVSPSAPPRNLYAKISAALSKVNSPIYRTFSYQRARRNALFVLQDFDFNPTIKKRLLAHVRVTGRKVKIKYD